LSYDLARLEDFDFSRVLAIVSANLYGIPNELPAIEQLARRHGVYMVDDAAQAWAPPYAGQPVGTFGDVGLFSLDKGKNITSMQGGILVTRDAEIASALHRRVAALPPAVGDTGAGPQAVCLCLPAAAARYGITRRLPFLGLGRTPYHATARSPATAPHSEPWPRYCLVDWMT
jgi:perosamine synthetase